MGDEEDIAVIAAAIQASLRGNRDVAHDKRYQKSLWRRSFHPHTPGAWKSTHLTWKVAARKELMKSRDLTHN